MPITRADIEAFLANPGGEVRRVALRGGALVGMAILVPARGELRARYVAPASARSGVGRALVGELERLAREAGLTELALASSLTAQPFYAALGYQTLEPGEHVLRTGRRVACVQMRKKLADG